MILANSKVPQAILGFRISRFGMNFPAIAVPTISRRGLGWG